MSARSAARAALILVALAVTLAAGVLLGLSAATTTADAVQPTPAPVEVPTALEAPDLSYGEPFLDALVGDGAGIPENADELILAADRVCEGLTAGVPLVVIADTVAGEFDLTDDDARHFVNAAGVLHCSPID